jgi:hypothetical protein
MDTIKYASGMLRSTWAAELLANMARDHHNHHHHSSTAAMGHHLHNNSHNSLLVQV